MNENADYRVREVGQARLCLRADLIVTPQLESLGSYYLVEDRLNSRYFRLGPAEYAFAAQLDGRTTVDGALTRLSNLTPDHQLTASDAASLCQFLLEMELAQTSESSRPDQLAAAAHRAQQTHLTAKLNPLAIRQPLCRPDRLFARIAEQTSWLFTPLATCCYLAFIASGTGKNKAARASVKPTKMARPAAARQIRSSARIRPKIIPPSARCARDSATASGRSAARNSRT